MAGDKKKVAREQAIDDNLKRVFQPTLEEEVPDRFKDLLAKLKDKDGERGGSA